uniref:Uncharacterized protein AlNc14C991G12701 n=1 Tax=Albugo laibachii Nc14 TaxID=890382 RepID=F0X2E2_9STRA|nr:conserved hypothetical protein [Albugo laibachii Nc14]|eukprot:CCA28030.1 conserved hypothetical protein [Albugo laibachii Nc14]
MDAVEAEANGSDPMELLVVVMKGERKEMFTRYRLQETLMLMGCRQKDAVIVTKEAFGVFKQYTQKQQNVNSLNSAQSASGTKEEASCADGSTCTNKTVQSVGKDPSQATTHHLPWNYLHQCIYSTLARLNYTKPQDLLDFEIAKEVTHRNQAFIVLLGGTSGTGKSTLASLLAARLRLTTVLPTDSIRHVLRSVTCKEQNPCAFVSTYQAGDALPPETIQELSTMGLSEGAGSTLSASRLHKRKILRGYKLQSQLVLEKLDQILTNFEKRNQSLVVEGVHLNTDQLIELVQKHPTCIPFVVYISNELKHRERFAVRARHMTVDPQENKYIKYFGNIRIIQRHLCKNADQYLIPKVDNTNVDRSLAAIHSTLVRVLRPMYRGERLFDPETNKMVLLSREHESAIKKAWSSKDVRKAMRPLIKQKVSKRLLLRRLLAEQTLDAFGTADAVGSEFSSSDEEGEVEVVGPSTKSLKVNQRVRTNTEEISADVKIESKGTCDSDAADAGDGEDENDGEDGEDEDNEDGEQATVVGSLASATTSNRDLLNMIDPSQRPLYDEIEEIATRAPEATSSARLMHSLSAAIKQTALWRARRPLRVDWKDKLPPPHSSEITFSEMFDSLQTSQASPFSKMRQRWKVDERRKSWMAGDFSSQFSRPHTSGPGVLQMPVKSVGSYEGKEQLLTRGMSLQPDIPLAYYQPASMTILENDEYSPARVTSARRSRLQSRRVRSLPPDTLEDLTVQDFDLDSVSVAASNEYEQSSEMSSERDACISPLEQSVEEVDSQFEVSSLSSDDFTPSVNEIRGSIGVNNT